MVGNVYESHVRRCISHNSLLIKYGRHAEPLIYQVHRVRDGHSFATRRITAFQKGYTIFFMTASFQVCHMVPFFLV